MPHRREGPCKRKKTAPLWGPRNAGAGIYEGGPPRESTTSTPQWEAGLQTNHPVPASTRLTAGESKWLKRKHSTPYL